MGVTGHKTTTGKKQKSNISQTIRAMLESLLTTSFSNSFVWPKEEMSVKNLYCPT